MIVVKVGGGAGIDVDAVLQDVAELHKSGHAAASADAARWGGTRPRPVVLVHGASDETNRLSEKLGIPPRFVTSPSGHTSRFTDEATLDAFAMASGKLNLRIVERLQRIGANAVGLTGVDGRLLEGERKDKVVSVQDGKRFVLRGDHTGTIERVNADLLRLLLSNGYLPVVTVPSISTAGEAVNADADRAAAAIAGALQASHLVILSNVPGLLRDVDDPSSLVARATVAEAEALAKGRFKKKVLGAQEALALGVREVVFATANVAGPVSAALAGGGTHVASVDG